MRTYGQFCALAKALDVIGDRWTLLIVRELLSWKRARYTDLKSGLPGIASNLLSERLRELEDAGIVTREESPPPAPATLYALTERGKALDGVIRELGRWGAPLLAQARKSDEARGHWIGLPAELYLRDGAPEKPPVTLEVRADGEPVTLTTENGAIRSRIGAAQEPDAVLSGPTFEVAQVLLGAAPLARARKRGVTYSGDHSVLERIRTPMPKP
jgi:DNA-binding HxlR family transcriptional regulator